MTQAIATKEDTAIVEQKRPLVMKSGLVHWLTEETASKLERSLAEQQAHGFVRISELGLTINTAEIGDGVLTQDEYSQYLKRKQGMWQCEMGNWHEKKVKECSCLSDKRRSERIAAEQRARDEENRPLSEEERADVDERRKKASEIMVLKGIIPHIRRTVRRSTILEFEAEGNELKVGETALQIDEDVIT